MVDTDGFRQDRRTPFHLLRIIIKTIDEGFMRGVDHGTSVHGRPTGPRIPVPTWLIEWSKSRDLFLSLAHDPWVYRPN
jgi:hypothetical protein